VAIVSHTILFMVYLNHTFCMESLFFYTFAKCCCHMRHHAPYLPSLRASYLPSFSFAFILLTMATCGTYHGIIGIQNGTHYNLNNKSFWRYEGFIPQHEGGDLPVEVFAFKGSSASTNKGFIC